MLEEDRSNDAGTPSGATRVDADDDPGNGIVPHWFEFEGETVFAGVAIQPRPHDQ